ncbi:hypothetical protein KM043_005383 [Ampulex compressa]|nr:hypothetical protein KM043_005383 [Ampulex compressa]
MGKLTMCLAILIIVSCAMSSQASFIDKVIDVKKEISDLVKKGIKFVKEKMDDSKAYADKMIKKMREKGHKASNEMEENVKTAVKQIDKRMDELTISANGVDISDCTKMAALMRKALVAVVEKSSSCIDEKIDQAVEYVEDLGKFLSKTYKDFRRIKKSAKKCDSETNDSPFTCLAGVLKKAAVIGKKKISRILTKWEELKTMAANTIPSLALCTTAGSVSELLTANKVTLKPVEECVASKIAKADKVTKVTVGPPKKIQYAIPKKTHNTRTIPDDS